MIRKITTFLVISLSLLSQPLLTKVHHIGNEKIIVTGKLESINSFISYVTINGQRYIIKQKKDPARQVMAAMREALAAYIAKDLEIAHLVQIISAMDTIPGKRYQRYPATLHTLAPGKIVSELKGHKYYLLCLKQRDKHERKVIGRWLTETIIYQITWHKQLAIIIALDLFISNTDRHSRNLFYDEMTDSFCAIDMENIFRRDLPEFACEKLNEMINVHKKKFTKEEIESIVLVKNTLEFLLKRYPPHKIIAHLNKYAKQAGYVNDGSSFNKKIAKKMAHHKKMIIQSHVSAHKLVTLLDHIINKSHE